jgi:hypothetical protein
VDGDGCLSYAEFQHVMSNLLDVVDLFYIQFQ